MLFCLFVRSFFSFVILPFLFSSSSLCFHLNRVFDPSQLLPLSCWNLCCCHWYLIISFLIPFTFVTPLRIFIYLLFRPLSYLFPSLLSMFSCVLLHIFLSLLFSSSTFLPLPFPTIHVLLCPSSHFSFPPFPSTFLPFIFPPVYFPLCPSSYFHFQTSVSCPFVHSFFSFSSSLVFTSSVFSPFFLLCVVIMQIPFPPSLLSRLSSAVIRSFLSLLHFFIVLPFLTLHDRCPFFSHIFHCFIDILLHSGHVSESFLFSHQHILSFTNFEILFFQPSLVPCSFISCF